MDNNYKEVRYDQYCSSCKYANESEAYDKCNECLNEPARLYSHKPLNWEEK